MDADANLELDDQPTQQSTSSEDTVTIQQQEHSTDVQLEMDSSRQPRSSSGNLSAMDVDKDGDDAGAGDNDNDNDNDIFETHSDSSSSLSDLGTDEEQLAMLTKVISDQQNKLSYIDRNILHEELHGVAFNEKRETPELLQYALSKLSAELETLVLSDWANNNNKNAGTSSSSLSTGYLLSPKGNNNDYYVNQPSFRLRFLRAENFHPRKAAIRLMKFLNLVLKVFGAFALTRPIKLTDFKRNEMKALQTGWLQVLPFRDRSGRRLFVWTGQMGMEYEATVRIKIALYMLIAGTRDVESQQKGIVAIIFPTSVPSQSLFLKDGKNQLKYLRLSNELEEARPVKMCCIHHCISSAAGGSLTLAEKILFKFATQASWAWIKRVKLHIRPAEDLREILSSYGIPVGLIPTTHSGVVKTHEFRKWLKLQRQIDDLEAAKERFFHVECPGSNDIVFRPGTTMTENPGNVMFRSLVESKCLEVIAEFERQLPPQKTKEVIAMEIINEIILRRPNARFLRWNNAHGYWVEFATVAEVQAKIAVTFRDMKLKMMRSVVLTI